jgi:hypothetical protein
MKRVYLSGLLSIAFAASAPSARAQQPTTEAQPADPHVTVRVRQVAGSSIYLDIGTRHGLATGDTLEVSRDSLQAPAGRLTVTASTETRSVLAFAGEPFAVTRGEALTLHLLREPAEAVPEPAAPVAPPPAAPVARPARAAAPSRSAMAQSRRLAEGPRPHGRIGLDLSADRSTTQVGTVDATSIDRTFATPAFRLDATVPGVMGGFQLRTSMRLAYRYSSEELIQPPASARVYAAALEREFTSVPLRIALGRFHSPVESYSGFWDGAFLRYGGRVGLGAMIGFEPDRWNERPSTNLPKATVFLDGRGSGRGWRWAGDFSAHAVRPNDSLPEHTFFGASQRLSAGPLHLGHDVQVDRDVDRGGWRVSRLRVNGSLDLGPGVQLRGAFSRRETWVQGATLAFFAPRRDRVDAGLALRGGSGYVALDGSRGKDAAGEPTWGATGSFQVGGYSGAGLSGMVARWSGSFGNTLMAAPAVSLQLNPAWLRFGYRYYRSDYLDRLLESHSVESSLDVPFGSGLRASGRMRVQWGGKLVGQSFDLSLYRIF